VAIRVDPVGRATDTLGMSLPPGFLDELRARTSIAQVVGRKVTWDPRKSNQGKGDWWAPCPFHQEKTASFHVDDRKGYYYCFGCQAKGDALTFVRETENVSFMEAVEILAGEAGMQMPARDPKAKEKADERSELADVMEQAVQFFRLQLRAGAGAAAREYLKGRGLNGDSADRWEIGFAPDAWQGLWDHLTGKGVAEDKILAAGLAKPSNSGKRPYDTFRNRIMFPIRDARGRAIAFGGRAMDPSDNAKYLNSPETILFDKGRTLFNHGPAREAAGKGQPVIVAEGYMDVIALSEAGFTGAVAPLGTAVTEHQLALLWRMTDEPFIALDGDAAGLRAAMRVIDLALPALEAGKSLRFAMMPERQDPDDVIRAGGPAAFQAQLDAAQAMVHVLWARETEGRNLDSPERKAALDKALRDKLRLIKDPSIRGHYGAEIKRLRWELFGNRRPQGRRVVEAGPQSTTKSSLLTGADDAALETLREAVVLVALTKTPALVPEFEPQLDRLDCKDARVAGLRDALLSSEAGDDMAAQTQGALESLAALTHVAIAPAVRRAGDVEFVRSCVAEELARLSADRGHQAEVAEAIEDFSDVADERLTERLRASREATLRSGSAGQEDTTEFDTAPNGAKLAKTEVEGLDALIGKIRFGKGEKR